MSSTTLTGASAANTVSNVGDSIDGRNVQQLHKRDYIRMLTKEAKQVAAAQQNVLADFRELFQLRNDVKTLTENNENLKSSLVTIFDQFSNPSLRTKIFC